MSRDLAAERRAPRLVVLENVGGALTSGGGSDFRSICATFEEAGYRHGALDPCAVVPATIASSTVVIRARADVDIERRFRRLHPLTPFHTTGLQRTVASLPPRTREAWAWWDLPLQSPRTTTFADAIEASPRGVACHSVSETAALIAMMSPGHRANIDAARAIGRPVVGALYKRTRPQADGGKVQRAEVQAGRLSLWSSASVYDRD